ncbi:MAG: MIP family channel protein [Vicinamibacteraceae bacterium]
MDRSLVRELAAECLGTFLLIAFGAGSVAQMVLSHHTLGTSLSVNISWGLAVMLGAYASAGVSGAHLNPAVSLAFAVFRDFPLRKVIPFAVAQTVGAFLASAVVFLTYREALDAFDGGLRAVGGPTATAGIWATYPQAYLSIAGGFVDQVVGTALLLIGLFALVDAKNGNLPPHLVPVAAGLLVLVIGATFGMNSGYAINPARDLGPRLFTAVAGWGGEVFRAGNGWWWVPIVAPPIGALLGAFVYDACITRLRAPAVA